MNVTTIEINDHPAIGGFIILGIALGVSITFCYFKKFRGGDVNVVDRRIHNESSDLNMVVI